MLLNWWNSIWTAKVKTLKDRILKNETTKTIELYEVIRNSGKETAKIIDTLCPESEEKDLAIRKIEEGIAWANAAVARHFE